jgi:hypothetical protein
MFFFAEYLLVAILIIAVYSLRGSHCRWCDAIEQQWRHFAQRRSLVVLLVAVLTFSLRAAVLPNLPVPQPGIHDDFAYLLLGDTFAHGRVANPTHPLWIYFESFHINQQPTYGTMFYPAQGLILALGQVIARQPYVGVWLTAAAMCAAICWMLQAWLPPGWALLGGVLAAMRLGVFSYWANSYCGGALAATGGALVLGALPRIERHQKVRDSLLMGLGIALLANTRPYESVFFGIPIALAAIRWTTRKSHPPWRRVGPRVVLPLGLLLTAALAATAYFFWRATGSPLRLPVQVNLDTYLAVPYFPWQPLNLKHLYHHAVMEKFYLHGWQIHDYYLARLHPVEVFSEKFLDFYRFFLGPAFALPIVTLLILNPMEFFRRATTGQTGFLMAVCGGTVVGLALPIYFIPHYAAPITAAIYALVLTALRHLRVSRWRTKRKGLVMARAIPAICVIMFLLRAFSSQLHIPTPVEWKHTWASEHFQNLDRARVLAQLAETPGEHLVIVRYNQYHDTANEWVYNRADIDRAKVVWARDMGDSGNLELIRYFRNRRIWLAEPDLAPPKLTPYASRAGQNFLSPAPTTPLN